MLSERSQTKVNTHFMVSCIKNYMNFKLIYHDRKQNIDYVELEMIGRGERGMRSLLKIIEMIILIVVLVSRVSIRYQMYHIAYFQYVRLIACKLHLTKVLEFKKGS